MSKHAEEAFDCFSAALELVQSSEETKSDTERQLLYTGLMELSNALIQLTREVQYLNSDVSAINDTVRRVGKL